MFLEGSRNPGHIDVVGFEQVEAVLYVLVFAVPTVTPCCSEHPALELWTVLQVVLQGNLGRGIVFRAPFAFHIREQEGGEAQGGFSSDFHVVVAVISFQACDGFVGSTNLEGEGFGTTEKVFVLIGCGEGSTHVAS